MKQYWPIIKDGIILLTITTVFVVGVSTLAKSLKKTTESNPVVTAINQNNAAGIADALSEAAFKQNSHGTTSLQDFTKKLANTADDQLRTPLMWAAYFNTSDIKSQNETDEKRATIIDTILQNGAEINARDEHGWTPLMWASWSGLTKTATRLIELGADIKIADHKGNPALMLAALRGNTEIVQFLINRGADRNFATAQGKIAKDFAEKGIAEHPTKVAEYQKILSIL
jgi:ankyrin repeat protein